MGKQQQGWQEQGGQRPGVQGPHMWQEGQESKSFVLRTYIVGGVGVKKLHIDWQVKEVPAFPGWCHYPNVGKCGVC